jgi:eukaryotic-like serine/threonine-protein kinase
MPLITDHATRISTLVDSTFGLSLRELRSFLERECPNDPELRAEIERRIVERETTAGGRPAHPSASSSLAIGDVVAGRYTITRLIGRGGMGEVYEAHDSIVKESVALKTLRADLTEDASFVKRFEDEIYLARKVTHRNVCRIYEIGVHPRVTPRRGSRGSDRDVELPPLLFFTMELLKGETLLSRIARGALTRAEAFPIANQLAEGLHAAHRAGIVHADFKSANVILVPSADGVRAVITDFGVARLDPARARCDETRTLAENVRLVGTLAYMSPEQLADEVITPASDLYSFGIVLFEMACGERPFDDRDLIRAVILRAAGQPTPIRTKVPGIDARWEGAIRRCLQKDPARRFASAADLAGWFSGGAWRPIRYWTRYDWVRAALTASLLIVAVTVVWSWWTRPYRPTPAAQQAYEAGVSALHSMTYETARRSLEESVSADPRFALAHAGLARAYDELDYTERAKDAMLRAVAAAQEWRLAPADERKLRAMQFMVSREYQRAVPLLQQIEAEAAVADRPAAALESGWLAQQMDDSEGAAAAFKRALELNPSHAAARLRLGFMFGREGGKDDLALAAFTEAEHLYRAAGNDEGFTQTLLERANLLDRRSREKEALPIIDQALAVARTVGNRAQEIRLRLLQATALRDLGDTTRAAELTRQTIDMALTENMDNLAASGLIDLGNIFLRTGDTRAAEPYFRRALDTAQRGSVRRTEARALVSLGSLCEQDGRPAEARQFVEKGLAFYRNAGYQRESIQAAVVLGGVLQQLGQHEEGIRILRDTLPIALTLQDRRLEAQLRERLADNLRDGGQWPAAVDEYDRSVALYGSLPQANLVKVMAVPLQWYLGQAESAERFLAEARSLLADTSNPEFLALLNAVAAEIEYASGRFVETAQRLRQAPIAALDANTARRVTLITGLVRMRVGPYALGLATATGVVNEFEKAGMAAAAAHARLSMAEALVLVGRRETALTFARDALSFLEPKHIWEALLRAHLVMARASEMPSEVAAHQAAAQSALAQLRTAWGTSTVDLYLTRPDLRRLSSGAQP